METEIRTGLQGKTLGPLKPLGRVRIDGQDFDACSQGDWIDAETDVVVIGSRSSNLVVRPLGELDPPTQALGEFLPVGEVPETTPLHAPPALVERFNAIAAGAVIGGVLIPVVWLRGTPLSFSAILLPVAGAVWGFVFQWFVRGALESVGPREDHRPRACEIAATVTGGAAIGAFIGLNIGFGFLGISCGLVIGALVAGIVNWIMLLLSAV